jgi:NAD(P)-dependent dehydrogenase (short-subunit alcohol dehydrogenase family)
MKDHQATSLDSSERMRVLVTGGTSGLGLALVHAFHARNADVAFVARTRQRIDEVMRRLPGTLGIVGDVADKDAIYPIALQVLGWRGGLDVLINNASSLGPIPLATLADTACEDFAQALETNVLGPFRLTKALLGALAASSREGRGAVVVNVSSDAAINAYANWGAYGASKAALRQMTRIFDEELRALGVRFLSIDPGDMDTPLHALAMPDADPRDLCAPADAARTIVDSIIEALPARERSRSVNRAAAAEAIQ